MSLIVSLFLSQSNGKVLMFASNRICIELGLLDYPQIVKRPMDFSTIKVFYLLFLSNCVIRKTWVKESTLLMKRCLQMCS